MKSSVKKGHEFELLVNEVIDGVIVRAEAEFRAEVLRQPRLMGFSTEWMPDLVLMVEPLLHPSERSLELAVFECKYVSETASEGTYWSEMSRGYMSLNDLRLIYREHLKFYLIVNRYSKSKKRDYPKIFKNIGVKMVNINDPKGKVEFERDVKQLLEETTFEKQAEKLKRIWQKRRQTKSL